MLSSTKSRRILHVISVSLAVMVFGYGLILKLNKKTPLESSDTIPEKEMVDYGQDSITFNQGFFEAASPD